MNLLKQIENYVPYNDQEKADKRNMLTLMKHHEDIFLRSNEVAHMTASAWVVNSTHDKVLMAYHNIYQSFSWLGGHCDGEKDCLKVAIQEVQEESGIQNVKPISSDIFSLEILSVDAHLKKGKYVPTHLHLNLTYLLEADEKETLKVKEDENSAVSWFDLEDAIEASNEEWFKENIYKKLNRKLKEYEND